MNKDNVVSIVPRISIATKTSAKSGNEYTQLTVHFSNGYELTQFLSKEQKKLIEYAIKEHKSSDDILDQFYFCSFQLSG